MAYYLAVANRKGGVGKSTVAVMLAHALSVWGNKSVLLIDLDAQSNSSLILIGGTRWIEAQRKSRNIAAYIEDRMYATNPIADYITPQAGDISGFAGLAPKLSLLAGSLRFEDMQDELVSFYSRGNTPFRQAKQKCANHFRQALNFAAPLADIVIFDCAPGLSNATSAALALANRVVVPFRPDAVSEFAVDKISTLIEGKTYDAVLDMPMPRRRYVCLANYVRPGGRDQTYIDTISFNHPTLQTILPLSTDLANAFYWGDERQTMDEKYGSAVEPLRALYEEIETLIGR
jgi:cellulose biosynthesis protein BcsQ